MGYTTEQTEKKSTRVAYAGSNIKGAAALYILPIRTAVQHQYRTPSMEYQRTAVPHRYRTKPMSINVLLYNINTAPHP